MNSGNSLKISTKNVTKNNLIFELPNTSGELLTTDINGTFTANGLLVNNNATIKGNLLVEGTTVSVNSTEVVLQDPVLTLGGNTVPVLDDTFDRGVAFRWKEGTNGRKGFFGFDRSKDSFVFYPRVTNSSETIYEGTPGNLNVGNITSTGTITVSKLDISNSITGLDIYSKNKIDSVGTITTKGGFYGKTGNLTLKTGNIFLNDGDITIKDDFKSTHGDLTITTGHIYANNGSITGNKLYSKSHIYIKEGNFINNKGNIITKIGTISGTKLTDGKLSINNGKINNIENITIITNDNNSNGSGLKIEQLRTQTGGSLVKITGTANLNALEVDIGDVKFGGNLNFTNGNIVTTGEIRGGKIIATSEEISSIKAESSITSDILYARSILGNTITDNFATLNTGSLTGLKHIKLIANNLKGDALIISNNSNQTSGDLVKITGTDNQTALNIPNGNVKFKNLMLDSNNNSGNALIISNGTVQTSGNLVQITGNDNKNALNIVRGDLILENGKITAGNGDLILTNGNIKSLNGLIESKLIIVTETITTKNMNITGNLNIKM